MALLCIEGGATCSNVIVQLKTKLEIQMQLGPANYTLLTPEGLQQFLEGAKREIEKRIKLETTCETEIEKVAIGLPGVLTENDRTVVARIVSTMWPKVEQIWTGSDVQIAFSCLDLQPQLLSEEFTQKCIIICGTGSVCFGKTKSNQPTADNAYLHMFKVGGNGHIIGDRGSGYSIGLEALRLSMKTFERAGTIPILLTALMKHLQLNSIPDLITWSIKATKTEIASLAKVVTQYWIDFKDNLATTVINQAIADLSLDFKALLEKLRSENGNKNDTPKQKDSILIGLTGSLLTECRQFSQQLTETIDSMLEGTKIPSEVKFRVLTNTVRGALNFITDADTETENSEKIVPITKNNKTMHSYPATTLPSNPSVNEEENKLRALVLPTLTSLPTTELRNKNSMNLDKLTAMEGIELMLNEEGSIYTEIRKEAKKISQLIQRITSAFKEGGRLFYVGAGTSGRLGILDASECPPTFKAPPEWVQGIIAGGTTAVFKAVEGAEDSVLGGISAVKEKELTQQDIVIGIAASGRTPFVWGALYEAKKSGAFTALLTFNPNLEVKLESLDMLLAINVGPEILTGSTRLKCGTATKSVLNMLTTLSMVQYGKCLENLMIDVMPTNEKLKNRAARIVLSLLGKEIPRLTIEEITLKLESHQYDIRKTVECFRHT